MAAGLEPARRWPWRSSRELRAAAGPDDQHLVEPRASRPRTERREMPADSRWLTPGGIAGVDDRPAGRPASRPRRSAARLRTSDVGRRVGLGAAGHVELAEEDQALALAVLQERAVLQAEAAVDDRQEVAARGLLDQHRGDVAAIAAPPGAGHGDVAPLDRRAVHGAAARSRAAAAGAWPRRASRAGAPAPSPARSG